jgi:hypothetical protein
MPESMVLPQPVFDVQRAAERASFDFGWLRTSHSFSLADYYDPRNVNWGALRVFNDDHTGAAVGTPAVLRDGDGVRIAGVTRLEVSGDGEVVLWDVPRPPDGAND